MASARDVVLRFLDLYREETCLSKIKSKQYCNQFAKERAYHELVSFCRQFDKNANKDTVTRKINNFRCAFRKEFNKYEKSKLFGSGSDSIYYLQTKTLVFQRVAVCERPGNTKSHHWY